MGQSMSSTGGAKQKGARRNQKNQRQVEPGQKMADQGGAKGKGNKVKPEGGADHGPRSVR